jgi:hypothetical protein
MWHQGRTTAAVDSNMPLIEDLDFRSIKMSWALVAHAYNPSYSGGRDQEDRGS